MKTILKLHPNGDLQPVNTQLVQSGIPSNYSFTENLITVPKIIEYPLPGTRNYFIEKTSVSGYVSTNSEGNIRGADEGDRVSNFIDTKGWTNATIRIRYSGMASQYQPWASVHSYNEDNSWLGPIYNDYVGTEPYGPNFEWEYKFLINADFIRVTSNFYDTPGVKVEISVEKGDTNNPKYYLAFEDMPEWVRDTGRPISIFPQGIVLKGDVIQSQP